MITATEDIYQDYLGRVHAPSQHTEMTFKKDDFKSAIDKVSQHKDASRRWKTLVFTIGYQLSSHIIKYHCFRFYDPYIYTMYRMRINENLSRKWSGLIFRKSSKSSRAVGWPVRLHSTPSSRSTVGVRAVRQQMSSLLVIHQFAQSTAAHVTDSTDKQDGDLERRSGAGFTMYV